MSAPTPEHSPCCSSHGEDMTCEKYRRTHFVHVRPCCGTDATLLVDEICPCSTPGWTHLISRHEDEDAS